MHKGIWSIIKIRLKQNYVYVCNGKEIMYMRHEGFYKIVHHLIQITGL